MAEDPLHAEHARTFGAHSLIAVPILAQDTVGVRTGAGTAVGKKAVNGRECSP
ncbi:hypothetical protein [Streptomyces geranii]|uniref:hypothetical protein n=1 Tax=Streptomyces geranii TaxID=2058923 RepID=UPI0013001D0D|nr:hypothetical protein [Streptomyces geranii]